MTCKLGQPRSNSKLHGLSDTRKIRYPMMLHFNRRIINKVDTISQLLLSLLSRLSTKIRFGPETPLLEGGSFASKRDRVDCAFVVGACDEVLFFILTAPEEAVPSFAPTPLDDEALGPATDLRFPLSSRLFSFSVWLAALLSTALEDEAPEVDRLLVDLRFCSGPLPRLLLPAFALPLAVETEWESRTKTRPLVVVFALVWDERIDDLCLRRESSFDPLESTRFRLSAKDSGGESGIPSC